MTPTLLSGKRRECHPKLANTEQNMTHNLTQDEWLAFARALTVRPEYPQIEPSSITSLDAYARNVVSMLDGKEWRLQGCQLLNINDRINWKNGDRTQLFHRHSWTPIGSLLLAYSISGDEKLFDLALRHVRDWQSHLAEDDEVNATKVDNQENFTWYDMAVGQRAYRLAYILKVLAYQRRDVRFVSSLVELMHRHFRFLTIGSNIAWHSNHGIFQIAGLLSAAQQLQPLFSEVNVGKWEKQLADVYLSHFATDGGHLEHSPGYHFYMTHVLKLALAANLFPTQEGRVKDLCISAENALAYMIRPDGYLCPFGDTDQQRVPYKLPSFEWFSPALLDVLARVDEKGAKGDKDETIHVDSLLLKSSGYAFARGMRATSFESFFATSACFHSRTHKQADSSTVFWQERDQVILDDAGRYGFIGRTKPGSAEHAQGFWYSDPNRMFVESSFSHNTVIVDGQSHRRSARDVFGSGLIDERVEGDWYLVRSKMPISETVEHSRLSAFLPSRALVVMDYLVALDNKEHDYIQNFQLSSEWRESGFLNFTTDNDVELRVRELTGHKLTASAIAGQTEPYLRGWICKTPMALTPALNFAFGTSAAYTARFITLLEYGRRGCAKSRLDASLSANCLTIRDRSSPLEIQINKEI